MGAMERGLEDKKYNSTVVEPRLAPDSAAQMIPQVRWGQLDVASSLSAAAFTLRNGRVFAPWNVAFAVTRFRLLSDLMVQLLLAMLSR